MQMNCIYSDGESSSVFRAWTTKSQVAFALLRLKKKKRLQFFEEKKYLRLTSVSLTIIYRSLDDVRMNFRVFKLCGSVHFLV